MKVRKAHPNPGTEMISLIHHPEGEKRLGDLLVENLSHAKWNLFRAAVAFVKRSGTKHVASALKSFLERGEVKLSVGIDHLGTSFEGLGELLDALGDKGEAYVFHNEARSTFHPKLYLFTNDTAAECFIGSGNLTEGGLFTNCEAFVHLRLKRSSPDDSKFLAFVEKLLDDWSDPAVGTVRTLTADLLKQLHEAGLVSTELEMREAAERTKSVFKPPFATTQAAKLFAAVKVQPAPRVAIAKKPAGDRPPGQPAHAPAEMKPRGFVMTLQRTDVGVGQVTKGTSKRSPEIFIPLAARDADPEFWGWQSRFKQHSDKPVKWDRSGVRMRLGREVIEVNMMTWPDKHDFRLRNATLS